MALLEFIYAAYIGVIITVLIGIFVEGEKAQLDNVLSNLSSFVLLLATTDMTWQLVLGLTVYLALGILIVFRKIRDLYLLFGAKSYGSISLVILFAESGLFGITFADLRTVLMGCIAVAGTVHVIGFIYRYRNRLGRKGTPDGKKKKGTAGRKKGRGRRARARAAPYRTGAAPRRAGR